MTTEKKQAELVREISGVNPLKCMKCGKCSATCPAFGEMDIKPHQFVSYVANGNIEALAESKSLYKCLSCFACIERCPRDVQPAKIIDAIKQLSADGSSVRAISSPDEGVRCRRTVRLTKEGAVSLETND